MDTPLPHRPPLFRLVLVAAVPLVLLGACSTDAPTGTLPDEVPPTTAAGTDTGTGLGRSGRPKLLFERDGTRRTAIALVDRDGSGEVAPVAGLGDGNQTNPDWSPSGQEFTFAMTHGATDDLWIAPASGTGARMLLDCAAPCAYLDDPAWSPTGDRIVYSRTVDRDGVGVSTLETVEVRTGRTRVLLGPWTEQFTAGARWSPDGRQVVFERVEKAGPGIWADVTRVTLSVVSPGEAERTVRSLTDPELLAATADWSPNGQWIVYSALATASAEAPDLFRVRSRGGAPEQLTNLADGGGYAAEPTYTPNGRWIVFSGGRDPSESAILLQVRVDGTDLALATGDVEVSGGHPRVRPSVSRG